jgi:hypothetical protein
VVLGFAVISGEEIALFDPANQNDRRTSPPDGQLADCQVVLSKVPIANRAEIAVRTCSDLGTGTGTVYSVTSCTGC